MAIVGRTNAKGETIYWIVFSHAGKPVWERVGPNRRKAELAEVKRKKQVKRGEYTHGGFTPATSFGRWIEHWCESRQTRNAKREVNSLRRHVLTRTWLARTALHDLRPRHMTRLADELVAAGISAKTAANIYGVVRTCVRDARMLELVTQGDVCLIPRDRFEHVPRVRGTYSREEIVALCSRATPMAARMWAAIAFFTGARQGEVCGLRWADWDESALPLGCLTIERQYDGQPLKTAKRLGQRARRVPVHPILASLLRQWRSDFEIVHKRPPRADDPLVPNKKLQHQTSSASYKGWRRACKELGVESRTVHATRHTFVSFCRRGGALSDRLERITHNAKGTVIDQYTHYDWVPLCDVVLRFWPDDVDAHSLRIGPQNCTGEPTGHMGSAVPVNAAKALAVPLLSEGSNPPAPTHKPSISLDKQNGDLRFLQDSRPSSLSYGPDSCPECGSSELEPVTTPEGEREGVRCLACRGRGAA
jgi:integrase